MDVIVSSLENTLSVTSRALTAIFAVVVEYLTAAAGSFSA